MNYTNLNDQIYRKYSIITKHRIQVPDALNLLELNSNKV